MQSNPPISAMRILNLEAPTERFDALLFCATGYQDAMRLDLLVEDFVPRVG